MRRGRAEAVMQGARRAGDRRVWGSYAPVYALMDDVPFVQDLRERHLRAMGGRRRIVDAGCGVGLIAGRLATGLARTVLGVDRDPAMLDGSVRRVAGLSAVRLLRGDAQALPVRTGACDGYVSNNVLYCVDDPARVLREAARVIQPGGVISISSPRPCIDVEVLLDAFFGYLRTSEFDVAQEDVDRFVASNRRLQRELKHLYEPDDAIRLLGPDWSIVEAGRAYLDQNFFVMAIRVGTSA